MSYDEVPTTPAYIGQLHSVYAEFHFITDTFILTLSSLSSHSMGSPYPELPDTTLFVAVFCEISQPIFHLYGNKSKTCSRYFGLAGIFNSRRSWFCGVRGLGFDVVRAWCLCFSVLSSKSVV